MAKRTRQRKQNAEHRSRNVKHFVAVAVFCVIIVVAALFLNIRPLGSNGDFDWSEFDRQGLSLKAQTKARELQTKYTSDQARYFLEDTVVPILDRARTEDPVPATRRWLNELYAARLANNVKISIWPGYLPAGQFFEIGVIARSVPKTMSTVRTDEIELSLAGLEQYRTDETRLEDVVISYFCHEWLHISTDESFANVTQLTRDQLINLIPKGEAKVWRTQVELQLLDMEKSGRFLSRMQRRAVNKYHSLSKQEWQAWVEKEHALPPVPKR